MTQLDVSSPTRRHPGFVVGADLRFKAATGTFESFAAVGTGKEKLK